MTGGKLISHLQARRPGPAASRGRAKPLVGKVLRGTSVRIVGDGARRLISLDLHARLPVRRDWSPFSLPPPRTSNPLNPNMQAGIQGE